MKATLYKIKEGYILCSDEKIREEICLNVAHRQIVKPTDLEWANSNSDNLKKVLTQSPDFFLLKEEDTKRIGWFDVESLAMKSAIEDSKTFTTSNTYDFRRGFESGFKKALSLTEDRRFTEEGIKEAIAEAWNSCEDNEDNETFTQVFDRIIKSLSQPKSWEVEYIILDGIYKILKVI